MNRTLQHGGAARGQREGRDEERERQEHHRFAVEAQHQRNAQENGRTAAIGIVSPILARADPREALRLVCRRLRRAAFIAVRPSGSSTMMAMMTPTIDSGSPAFTTAAPSRGDSDFARKITTTRLTIKQNRTDEDAAIAGGSRDLQSHLR